MKTFSYNRNQTEFMRVMKSKAEKKGLYVTAMDDRLQVSLQSDKFSDGENAVPVIFKGKLTGTEEACSLKGKFCYGFYLYTLVIVAAVLIVARFAWSAYQKQTDNMILCGIVTLILIIVIYVVHIKSRPAKRIICDFLGDLNVK